MEAILERDPAANGRRPKVDDESPTLGLARNATRCPVLLFDHWQVRFGAIHGSFRKDGPSRNEGRLTGHARARPASFDGHHPRVAKGTMARRGR
jgi:hypothetical protein